MTDIQEYGKGKYSFSFLKNFARSPKHALAYLLREQKDTQPKRFGRIFHSVMAGQLNDEFLVYNMLERPEPDKTMAAKANRAWHSDMVDTCLQDGLELVEVNEVAIAEMMRGSVMGDKVGEKLLNATGEVEKSIENDVLKGRLDLIIPDKSLVVDWKSISEIRLDWLESDLKKWHYDLQAAIYNELTGFDIMFYFIEKTAPFDVLPVMVEKDSDFMQNGRAKLELYYAQAKECFDTGEWAGISQYEENGIRYVD